MRIPLLIRSSAGIVVAAFLNLGVAATASAEEPVSLFLTWQQDPTTTMTVDWHTLPTGDGEDAAASTLRYKPADGQTWQTLEGSQRPFPFSDRTVHRVELTGLEPATAYRFRVGEFDRTYSFRTMPENLNEPLVFAAGGDTRHSQARMERTNRVAMAYDPEFIVWGGDLAYANGLGENVDRWYEWFDAIMNTLITEDGRVVPIVLSIGNHEMKHNQSYRHHDDYAQTDEWRAAHAPFFYGLFAFPGQPGYDVLDFADYLSLILLDSGHSNPYDGEQTEWLEAVLKERGGRVPHVIPTYHVPMFPSVRGDGETPRDTPWRPLFEAHGVRIAFENHDHAYKRTHPIRDGAIDPTGVVYIGDGAWGVGTRDVHDPEETWYLSRAEKARHAIIMTLHGPHQHARVVDENGDVIDEYPAAHAPRQIETRHVSGMTVEGATGNLVETPLPAEGEWSVSQRGDSTGAYAVVTRDDEQVIKLHDLRYEGDRPRFRANLRKNLPNDEGLIATYSFRARANQPTRIRSRLHGSGGTISDTQTHELTTDWKYVSYTQELAHDREHTETLKFSLMSDEDYEGVKIYLDEITAFSGVSAR